MARGYWTRLYARAFYAAGDTVTPMVACTLITIASLPLYSVLFQNYSFVGLAAASDLGILANTLALMLLLHSRKLVRWDGLPWGELSKAALISVAAALLSYQAASIVAVSTTRTGDLISLTMTTLTWAAAVAAGLWITKSDLLTTLRRRKNTSSEISSK